MATKSISPSTADVCSRALALLIEGQQMLEQLVENGEVERGSPPEATLWELDNAIGMLTPDDVQDAEMAAAIARDKAKKATGPAAVRAGDAAMSATERRAAVLAQARDLQQALQELPGLYGPGSCPALAADLLDDAISYLQPSPPGPDENADDGPAQPVPSAPPRLRIVGAE